MEVLAFNPLSREQIAKILGISTRLITTNLRHLHSVLLIPNEDSKEIRIFHKSFPDFLQDPNRCCDPKFLIDASTHHGDMALGCLELLKKLKPNPCNLPNFVMNRDVPNLPELLEDKVGGAMRYACGYWAMHVRSSPTMGDYPLQLITSATEFFEANTIQWIEVMSLEGQLESVIHSINNLFDWFNMVKASTYSLRGMAEDYLRFTKNFFHLIQQSAPHIYHSALPLSPRSSSFHSKIPWEKTPITKFYGCPETWGVVIQTIRSGPASFMCMTTFGHWIAMACSDGVVRIYHAVTGALRLSLGPMDVVKVVGGSLDGSTLFCAHQDNSITLWDIQTGGLIRAFALLERVQGIDVSLKGRYLACGFSSGSIKLWEVTNRVEGTAIQDSLSNAGLFCWLEPEEQLAITDRASVHIWDVVAGRILRSFGIIADHQKGYGSKRGSVKTEQGEWISGVAYSRVLDQLVVLTKFRQVGSTVTVIYPQAGTRSASFEVREDVTCFALSRTTEELVCGMRASGLTVLNFSKGWWSRRHLKLTHAVRRISSLPNGTVAVDSGNSGVKLLSLDQRYGLPSESTLALAVSTFDKGGIIACCSPTPGGPIQLLDVFDMSNVFSISALGDSANPLTAVLCASLDHRMVVYYLQVGDNVTLRLHRFSDEHPTWTVGASGRPLAGVFSPGALRLVTFHDMERAIHICVWDARDGRLQAELSVDRFSSSPPHISSSSEERFYSHHDNYHVPYELNPSPSADTTHLIIRHEPEPWTIESKGGGFEVDSSREWVVSSSKRIYWIPPGYIGPNGGDWCWARHNRLVMIGEDKVLRVLTFIRRSSLFEE